LPAASQRFDSKGRLGNTLFALSPFRLKLHCPGCRQTRRSATDETRVKLCIKLEKLPSKNESYMEDGWCLVVLTEEPSGRSLEAEWRDERRQRWLFNIAVLFLLIPFTVLISYMIGSLIGLGSGVSLAGYRLAATPEITNRISSRIRGRPRKFLRDLVIGLVGGFTLLGVSDFVSLSNVRNAQVGYPLSYTQPDSSCFSPGWPLGCPILYHLVYIILDYLFWAVVAFAFVSIFRLAWIRLVHSPGKTISDFFSAN